MAKHIRCDGLFVWLFFLQVYVMVGSLFIKNSDGEQSCRLLEHIELV